MVYNGCMKYSGLNVVFLCVFVAMFVGSLFLIRAQFDVGEVARPDSVVPSEAENPLVPVALAEYVNVRGEKWRVVKGTYDFEATASVDAYPSFVSGILDPLDVQPGETQRMRVVVNDTSALSEVYAEIGHDKGKDIVPLKLVSAGAVSRAEQFKGDFFFDEGGVLTAREEWLAAHPENSASLVASAAAQSIRQYVYEGEWVVHDTHRTTYSTTFYAKSVSGSVNHMTLAWSDPICIITTATGVLNNNCNLTGVSQMDGIDGYNLNLNGYAINLGSGAKFGMAPGNSVTKSALVGSGIFLGPSGSKGTLVKQYVYYPDADSDGYPSSSLIRSFSSASALSGYIRMSAAPGTDKRNPTADCYENPADLTVSAQAHPGQTLYFYNRGLMPGYDFDCDGSITPTFNNSSNPATVLLQTLCGYHKTRDVPLEYTNDFLDIAPSDCGQQYTASGGATCTGTCLSGTCGGGGMRNGIEIAASGLFEKFKNFLVPIAEAIPWVPRYGFYRTNSTLYSVTVYSLCH